jgi:hypothetical protein
MAAFIQGDTPVADFDYDLPPAADFDDVTLSLSVGEQTVPAQATGQAVTGSWRSLVLPSEGIFPVYLVVVARERRERVLVDWLVVVSPDDEWHNPITARIDWAGAPELDGTLYRLLDVAREQIADYAPLVRAGESVPERYRSAQLMQARNTWNASLTNGDGQVDVGGFVVNVRPLDWAVKQLLRPKTATKAFG